MATEVFTDLETGRTLEVSPGEIDGERLAMVAAPKGPFPVPAGDLVDVAIALFAAAGQPVPVITPRPDVDVSRPQSFGPLTLHVAGPGRVRVQGGAATEVWDPSHVRMVAGVMAAFADAAEAGLDAGRVSEMAGLLAGAGRMAPDDAARYLLGKGVRLPGEEAGRG